jgi:hypothetical protein
MGKTDRGDHANHGDCRLMIADCRLNRCRFPCGFSIDNRQSKIGNSENGHVNLAKFNERVADAVP